MLDQRGDRDEDHEDDEDARLADPGDALGEAYVSRVAVRPLLAARDDDGAITLAHCVAS